MYSGSEYTRLVSVIVVDPTFVRVSLAFRFPVVPTVTEPKLKLVADSVSALPTPVRLMVEGLLGSESVITNVAGRVPEVVGLKAV